MIVGCRTPLRAGSRRESWRSPYLRLSRSLAAAALPSRRHISTGGLTMNRTRALIISLAVALAAIAGVFALGNTVSLGSQAHARRATSRSPQRTAQLDRYEASLRKALAQKPPALPRVSAAATRRRRRVRRTPVQSAAPARVVYHRPPPVVVTTHRAGGEHEDERDEHERRVRRRLSAMTDTSHRALRRRDRARRLLPQLGSRRREAVGDARSTDPRLAALAQREAAAAGRREARRSRSSTQRMAAYRIALKSPQGADRAQAQARTVAPGRAGPACRPRRAVRPRRQPAAADDHADVVMLRRSFTAMGTDVELLLDAEPGERAERALDRAEAEFERLEQMMSRFRDDSELSRLNRDGPDRGREPRPRARRRARARGPRGAPAAGSTRPSTTRSSLPATTARSTRRARGRTGPAPSPPRRCGGGVRVDGRDDRARPRHAASISAGSARATPSTASPSCSPSPARASSTPAATSPSAAARGPSASPTT